MRNGCHHHIVTDTETGQWSVIKEAVVQLSTNRPITSHNVHRWKCNKRRKETAAVVGLFVALETLIGFAVWLTAAMFAGNTLESALQLIAKAASQCQDYCSQT